MSNTGWQRLHNGPNEDGDEEFANLEAQQQPPQQSEPPTQQNQAYQYSSPQKSKIRRPGVVGKPSRDDDEDNPLFLDPQWEKIVLGVLCGTLFIVIIILVLTVVKPDETNLVLKKDPEQIRVTLGDNETTMFFVWATQSHDMRSDVRYGTDKHYIAYYSNKGWTDSYSSPNYTSPLFHYNLVTSLSPYATYYYQVGDKDKNIWSEIYSFKTPTEYNIPFTASVLASLEQTETSDKLLQVMHDKVRPDLALLVGDLSFAQGDQAKWDAWGNWIQKYTVSTPWMFIPGNLENEKSIEFLAYETRFPVSRGLLPAPTNSSSGNTTASITGGTTVSLTTGAATTTAATTTALTSTTATSTTAAPATTATTTAATTTAVTTTAATTTTAETTTAVTTTAATTTSEPATTTATTTPASTTGSSVQFRFNSFTNQNNLLRALRNIETIKEDSNSTSQSTTQTTNVTSGTETTSGTSGTGTTSGTSTLTGTTTGSDNNPPKKEKYHFYSFDYSYVHFVQLSSELTPTRNTSQFAWLVKDLNAVDHQKTPWIVASWHTPWYSSNLISEESENTTERMQKAYERLLYNHDVDICLTAHVHAYERSYRIYKNETNAGGMYHFSVGTGGSVEGLDTDWVEPQPQWSAFRIAAYGASSFHVYNETHIQWKYLGIDGRVLDDFWILKKKKKN